MNSENSEIAKYSYLMITTLLLTSIVNYAYQILMGLLLPKSEFGILGVALSVFYIAVVLTQNTFSWTATRRISSNIREASKILRTTVVGNLLLAILTSVTVISLSSHSEAYRLPMIIVAACLITSSVADSYSALFRAMRKFVIIAIANIFNSVIKLVVAIVLVMVGFGAVGSLIGFFASIFMVTVYLYLLSFKLEIKSSNGWDFGMILETIPISMTFLGISFLINGSILFLRYFGASDVLTGDYNAALTIARAPFFLANALITVTFTYISATRGEEMAFQTLKYAMLFVFPLCISMFIDPQTWLNLFFSTKYLEASSILKFLSLGIGFLSLTQIISSNLVAMEKPLPSALVMIVSSVILVMFVFHATSAVHFAMAVMVASLAATLFLLLYYIWKYYFKATPAHVLKLIISYVTLSIPFYFIELNGRITSLLEIVVAFTLYFLVLTLLNLFDEKDVEILFSPFSPHFKEFTRRIVLRVNKLGF